MSTNKEEAKNNQKADEKAGTFSAKGFTPNTSNLNPSNSLFAQNYAST